ncbi:hypothetical protein DIE19_35525 [Burkholderia sp. Bp9126]|nr:hypothetical protein DIE19_35525 [Burkholderia sp. Bp9126]
MCAIRSRRACHAQLEATIGPLFAHRNREGVTAEVIDLFGATPEVERIDKSKARQPYEFDVKTSLAITEKSGLIVGARTFAGNAYDGHTLSAQLEQTRLLLEDVPGESKPKTMLADLGYRGADAEPPIGQADPSRQVQGAEREAAKVAEATSGGRAGHRPRQTGSRTAALLVEGRRRGCAACGVVRNGLQPALAAGAIARLGIATEYCRLATRLEGERPFGSFD